MIINQIYHQKDKELLIVGAEFFRTMMNKEIFRDPIEFA